MGVLTIVHNKKGQYVMFTSCGRVCNNQGWIVK